jgi:hypothetical protein
MTKVGLPVIFWNNEPLREHLYRFTHGYSFIRHSVALLHARFRELPLLFLAAATDCDAAVTLSPVRARAGKGNSTYAVEIDGIRSVKRLFTAALGRMSCAKGPHR